MNVPFGWPPDGTKALFYGLIQLMEAVEVGKGRGWSLVGFKIDRRP